MFECCEHEGESLGFPEHVYSPWKCLGKDPFYSCNRVKKECLNETDGERPGRITFANFH